MSTVLEQIEQQIAKLSSKAVKKNTGNIRTVADGVAKIDGLSAVMYNEMVQFPGGAIGIALNLEEDEVGCVVLGDVSLLKEGDEVTTTGKLLSVPVGKALLGRAVDALGNPVDGKGPIAATETYPVEKIAPGIIVRKSVSQPLFTGIMAIDSMIPIGRGQRELIIGDRGTGKTTICIDTIINQAKINKVGLASGDPKFRPVYSIYVAVGQKNSNIVRTMSALEAAGALEFTIIVAAPAADNPANQYLAPFSGASMGEWFMENGMDALIVYDDLSKHAVAYRQISLILKRPSGREAYPGDVFYLHSRLLERAAKVVAIEVDYGLVEQLRQKFGPRLEVIHSDVLTIDLAQWGRAPIAGNLPYYIASPILEKTLRTDTPRAVFLIQKEVADRIVAKPGTRDYGYLTVQTALFAEPHLLFQVKPGAFRPPPKVDSAVVLLEPRARDLGGFIEYVRPGAFRRSLAAGADVVALVSHDTRMILGRTVAGTLQLSEDGKGLHFEIAVPPTTASRDLLVSIERGDVAGASFAFTTPQGGDRWSFKEKPAVRELLDVDLIDVTVTALPAYPETSVAMRSLQAARPPLSRILAGYYMDTL